IDGKPKPELIFLPGYFLPATGRVEWMPRFCLHGSAMTRPGFKAALLHPRYWPMWLGLGLLWLLIQLPYRVLLLLRRVLSRLMSLCTRERREIGTITLEPCFPAWRAVRRKTVLG